MQFERPPYEPTYHEMEMEGRCSGSRALELLLIRSARVASPVLTFLGAALETDSSDTATMSREDKLKLEGCGVRPL